MGCFLIVLRVGVLGLLLLTWLAGSYCTGHEEASSVRQNAASGSVVVSAACETRCPEPTQLYKTRGSVLNPVETGWYPRVFVSGSTKIQIKSTPIEMRPNRPFHFYGNTVRRQYYRGNPLPLPRDFARTGFSLIRR